MAIRDWPISDRPREKLFQKGAAALSDSELLAIFLRTGHRGCSAVELARELITRFGGIRGLLAADQSTFCQMKGLGAAKWAMLQAATELVRRNLEETLTHGEVLSSPQEASRFLVLMLRHYRREVFCCLFLDSQHRLLASEELFLGTIDSASVYPREVVQRCLHHNAAAVIFAHNHPSGVAEPSQADRQITKRLQAALELLDIRVLDHVVVGDESVVSLAEKGWL